MRIHSDNLDEQHVIDAARAAGVGLHRLELHGSRRRFRAFDVILTGSSSHAGNSPEHYRAATWDEWGMVLAALFERDPNATVPKVYADAADFHWQTDDRFRSLAPADQHARHRWDYRGRAGSADNAYVIHRCVGRTGCGAVRRFGIGQTLGV